MSALPTTRWSLVFAARDGGAVGRAALGELCEHYRPVVLGFFRRQDAPQLRECSQAVATLGLCNPDAKRENQ